MPTASPIITASRGAELEIVMNAEAPEIPATTMPTPMRALIRGMPAARRDPNVITSTKPAKTTPNTSVTVRDAELS